jgi:uncharacterized lipoprotein YbaY
VSLSLQQQLTATTALSWDVSREHPPDITLALILTGCASTHPPPAAPVAVSALTWQQVDRQIFIASQDAMGRGGKDALTPAQRLDVYLQDQYLEQVDSF